MLVSHYSFADRVGVLDGLFWQIEIHHIPDQSQAILQSYGVSCAVLEIGRILRRYLSEDSLQRFLVDRVDQVNLSIEQLLLTEGVSVQAVLNEEFGEFVILWWL